MILPRYLSTHNIIDFSMSNWKVLIYVWNLFFLKQQTHHYKTTQNSLWPSYKFQDVISHSSSIVSQISTKYFISNLAFCKWVPQYPVQWRNSYYWTFYVSKVRSLVTFYSIYEVKCDQKVEYVKSLIVKINPL